jgi:hypothetical protein
MKRLLTLIACLLLPNFSFAQVIGSPGQDGVGGVLTGVVNTYYAGLGLAVSGSSNINLGARDANGASTPIQAGDMLLVIQMQDASLDTTNTDSYGDGVVGNPASGSLGGSAGLYEFVVASADATANSIAIQGLGAGNGLINTYTSSNATPTQGQQRFQVIRVPQLSSATLSSGLTAAPWNGLTGGVLVLDIAGTATIAGTVDVSGKGFRGAGGRLLSGAVGATGEPIEYRVNAAFGTDNDGGKGEGMAGTPRFVLQNGNLLDLGIEGYPNGSAGFAAPANAGGGGTNATGGGGGGNGGRGGRGGDNWSPTETTPAQRHLEPLGGFGGANANPSASRLLLGGGGGAGANRNLQGAHGGAGGGIVLIRAARVTGSGTIKADGEAGTSLFLSGSAGNVGGGGAGGSVLLTTTQGSISGLNISVRGGAGASIGGGTTIHAAGGGGGGGLVFLSSSTTVFADGGARGSSPAEFDANNGGSGEIPASYLPERGQDGVLPVVGIDPVRDVVGVPGGASVLPIVSVGMSASPNTAFAGDLIRYSIRVENALGRAPVFGIAPSSDGLPTGFTFLDVEQVIFSGGTTGPVNPSISGPNNAPTFGVAAGTSTNSYTIPPGGSLTLIFRVQVSATASSGLRQHPASVAYLDPGRSLPNGLVTVKYDANASVSDDVDVTAVAAPVANNDSALTTTNQAVVVDVLQNDTNPAGGAIEIDLDPNTSAVELEFISALGRFDVQNQKVNFTPNPLVSGTVELEYVIINRLGVVSNRAKVTVFISSTVPIARDDQSSTTDVIAVPVNVLANDSNPVSGTLTIDLDPNSPGVQQRFERLGQGIFEVTTNAVLFTPKKLFDGLVEIQYTIQNDLGFVSNRATLRVQVRRVTTNVSGLVFADQNSDGIRQISEIGLAQVRVLITDANTTQEILTDLTGAYRVEVSSGLVQTRVLAPTGVIASTPLSQTVQVLPGAGVETSPVGFTSVGLNLAFELLTKQATIGQAVGFRLIIENTSGLTARQGVITLRLPSGIRFLESDGTATVLGSEVRFTWQLNAKQKRIIKGTLMVTPTQSMGTVSLRAEANATFGEVAAPTVISAKPVEVSLQISENQVGTILGLVYQDLDLDNRFSSNDLVFANVPVILSNGWVAKTDAKGRYSFQNVPAGTYWLGLDLPNGFKAKLMDGLETRRVTVQSNTITSLEIAVVSSTNSSFGLAVGVGSLQASLGSTGFSALLGMQGVVRLPFGDWKFTGVFNLTFGYQNGLFALAAPRVASNIGLVAIDAVSQSNLGQSDDGLFLRLESSNAQIEYGRNNSQFSALLLPNQSVQGLHFSYSENAFQIRGYGSLTVNKTNLTVSTPYGLSGTGSRVYSLSNDWLPMLEGSERIILVTRDQKNFNLKVKPDKLLIRGQDYTLDSKTGILTLFTPLNQTDFEGNLVFLEITASSPNGQLQLHGALEAQYQEQDFGVGAVLGWLDSSPTVLLQAQTQIEGLSARGEFGWSGDFVAAAQLAYQQDTFRTQLTYRHLGLLTTGITRETPALNLGLQAQYVFNTPIAEVPEINSITIEASATHQTPYTTISSPSTNLQLTTTANFGTSRALLGYVGRWAAIGANPGQFLQVGYAYQDLNLMLQLNQRIPVSAGTFAETEFSSQISLSDQTKVQARLGLTFAPDQIRTDAWIGISSQQENQLIRFGLALPNLNQIDSAAILTLNTTMPINQNFSLSAGAQYRFGQARLTLQTGLLFTHDLVRLSSSLDLNVAATGISLNASLAGIYQPSEDSLIVPSLRWNGDSNSLTYTLQGGFRNRDWTILSQNQGQLESQQSILTGDLRVSYGFDDQFSVRTGLAYRLELGVLTLTTAFGVSQRFDDIGLRLGGQLAWQWQPSSNSSKLAFGIEGSIPLDTGLHFTLGLNLIGFLDNSGFQTNPGVYIRLDYSFEQFLKLIFPK